MWPLDFQYPTRGNAFQAFDVIWARLASSPASPKPDNALFARALYAASGYGLSLGFPGSVPTEAQTPNPEARVKEILNPYFGQPIGTNMGQHVGGVHPRFDLGNLDWLAMTPLLLQVLKILQGTKPAAAMLAEEKAPTAQFFEMGGQRAFTDFPDFPPAPTDVPPEQATITDEPPTAGSTLPGYPPRNIPE